MKFLTTIACLLGAISAIKINEATVQPSENIFTMSAKRSRKGGKGKKNDNRGEIIEKLGLLSQAIMNKDEGNRSLNVTEVLDIAKADVAMKELNITDEQLKPVVEHVFNKIDGNGDGSITRQELLGAFFSLVDKDQDGVMQKRELVRIVKVYAKFLKVDLKEDWKKEVS